jgi:hypothetical protein
MLLCLLVALNLLDAGLHVATNQVEVLRITGNMCMIVASVIVLARPRLDHILAAGLTVYLVLNGIFVALNNIGNAGAVFIIVTTVVAAAFLRLK